jgi:hypothetical protein
MTDWWIFVTSYYGPDYNKVLWRPDRDVRLELQGVLELEPYRSVWEHAVRESGRVGAIASGWQRRSRRCSLTSGSGSRLRLRLRLLAGTVDRAADVRTGRAVVADAAHPDAAASRVGVIGPDGRAIPEAVLAMVAQLVGFQSCP